jgi:hypothetical protein
VRLDGGVQVFLKKEDAVTFFSEARQKFETEGCRQWSIDRLTAEPLGETAAVATIDWEMMRDDRSRIRGWRQTYNLLGRPGHWKVVLSTLHAGSEAG